ncbi:MAG TPA: hypothetical protein VNS46_01120 [Nocardioides sp.]|nr:hypothetical protein [Nocardioides sp.]
MATGPGIQEPLPTLLRRVLRGVVREHALAEHRRTHPAVLHVGIPRGEVRHLELRPEDRLDLALRTEMVEAMARGFLAADTVPLVWLTRMPEGPDVEDLAWAAAVGAASGELGVRLDLVVVTRRSWQDPRSGVGQAWARIRADA